MVLGRMHSIVKVITAATWCRAAGSMILMPPSKVIAAATFVSCCRLYGIAYDASIDKFIIVHRMNDFLMVPSLQSTTAIHGPSHLLLKDFNTGFARIRRGLCEWNPPLVGFSSTRSWLCYNILWFWRWEIKVVPKPHWAKYVSELAHN